MARKLPLVGGGASMAGLPGVASTSAAVKPTQPNKPAVKVKTPPVGFKRRRQKKLGLPQTGVGSFSPKVKTPGVGGRF